MLLSRMQEWAIEKIDSGAWLGTRDRYTGSGTEFGGRVPLLWPTLRDAKQCWLRFAVGQGYVQRTISLPPPPMPAWGRQAQFEPGPNFDVMPPVRFVLLQKTRSQTVDVTPEDIGIA